MHDTNSIEHELELLREQVAALTAMLNVPRQDCEATNAPWWVIVIPRQIMRPSVDDIANCVIGPYFSRAAAQAHLDSRRYAYGEKARVYCMSGHWSPEYRDVLTAAHSATSAEVRGVTP